MPFGEPSIFGTQLLGEIPSRDGRTALVIDDDLLFFPAVDIVRKPTTVWVMLSTGQVFASPPVTFKEWSTSMSEEIRTAERGQEPEA